MNDTYTTAACRMILRDIGECSCDQCIGYYLLVRTCDTHTALCQLAQLTGAATFQLGPCEYYES